MQQYDDPEETLTPNPGVGSGGGDGSLYCRSDAAADSRRPQTTEELAELRPGRCSSKLPRSVW